jgi:phage gp36-like protein
MLYATRPAMVDRFTEREMVDRTDLAEPYTREIVDAVLNRAMTAADAEVDAALRARYAVPLSPVPDLVVDLACDLARWRLWADRASDAVTERARVARATLDRLAKGQLVLDVAAAPASGGSVLFDGPGQVFTADALRGF